MKRKEPEYLRDLSKLDNLLEEIREEALNREGVREEMEKLKEFSPMIYDHGLNVCRRACLVAFNKEIERDRIVDIATASLLVDCGSRMVRKELLEREGKLSKEEFFEVKQHVKDSVQIARELNLPNSVVTMIENHHERNNGNGYLNKVKLEECPYDVQLVAACDCFEALREKRPYRSRHTLKESVDMMKYQERTDFNMELILDVTNTLIFD